MADRHAGKAGNQSDTIRAVSMARTGINANEVVASIVIERVFGFVSVLLLGLCSLCCFR